VAGGVVCLGVSAFSVKVVDGRVLGLIELLWAGLGLALVGLILIVWALRDVAREIGGNQARFEALLRSEAERKPPA
jgi:protein-S-isoprenylcysteine O-methyltransferase Ste14